MPAGVALSTSVVGVTRVSAAVVVFVITMLAALLSSRAESTLIVIVAVPDTFPALSRATASPLASVSDVGYPFTDVLGFVTPATPVVAIAPSEVWNLTISPATALPDPSFRLTRTSAVAMPFALMSSMGEITTWYGWTVMFSEPDMSSPSGPVILPVTVAVPVVPATMARYTDERPELLVSTVVATTAPAASVYSVPRFVENVTVWPSTGTSVEVSTVAVTFTLAPPATMDVLPDMLTERVISSTSTWSGADAAPVAVVAVMNSSPLALPAVIVAVAAPLEVVPCGVIVAPVAKSASAELVKAK